MGLFDFHIKFKFLGISINSFGFFGLYKVTEAEDRWSASRRLVINVSSFNYFLKKAATRFSDGTSLESFFSRRVLLSISVK